MAALCAEVRRLDPGIVGCRRLEGAEAWVCGQHGAGCLGVALAPAEATWLPGIRLLLWGLPVWLDSSSWQEQRWRALPEGGRGAPVGQEGLAGAEKVWVMYCGSEELDISQRPQWSVHFLREPLESCGAAYRKAARAMPADAWILILSPYAWGWDEAHAAAAEAAIRHATERGSKVVGFPMLDRSATWHWPCQSIRYQYWKLSFTESDVWQPGQVRECVEGDSTSGTRLYGPGVLPELLAAAVSSDPATLLAELDLLAQSRGIGPSLTCPSIPVHEDPYLPKARFWPSLARRYQLEAVQYTPLNAHDNCSGAAGAQGWQQAHHLSDQRVATGLCYRRQIESQFADIVSWWVGLGPAGNFATAKQGTLLTAMIRGGEVSMMPWDSDLELVLLSEGPNPLMGWCGDLLTWPARSACVARQVEGALGLPCEVASDFLAQWLYEEHLVFAKLRLQVAGVFDVTFEGWVPRMPISVPMFGGPEVRVSWDLWEYLFFEVFGGSLAKKVGTSGNVAGAVESCGSSAHNACLPTCDPAREGASCVLEFQDFFAHTRDSGGGDFFPTPDAARWPAAAARALSAMGG